jgi:hypothetical protein
MDQRRIPFPQRDDRRRLLNRKKIEPAPNRPIAVLTHRFEIAARQMIDLNLDFQNAATFGALKSRP